MQRPDNEHSACIFKNMKVHEVGIGDGWGNNDVREARRCCGNGRLTERVARVEVGGAVELTVRAIGTAGV